MRTSYFLTALVALGTGYNVNPGYRVDPVARMVLNLHNKPDALADDVIVDITEAAMSSWNSITRDGVPNPIQIELDSVVLLPGYGEDGCGPEDSDAICFFSTVHGGIPALTKSFTPTSPDVVEAAHVVVDPAAISTVATLYNTLLHEFGHVNLLGHSEKRDSVMGSGVVQLNGEFLPERKFDRLTRDDIFGVLQRMKGETCVCT